MSQFAKRICTATGTAISRYTMGNRLHKRNARKLRESLIDSGCKILPVGHCSG